MLVMFLDKYGVEARGIERVPPDQRTQTCKLDLAQDSKSLTTSDSPVGTILDVVSCKYDSMSNSLLSVYLPTFL